MDLGDPLNAFQASGRGSFVVLAVLRMFLRVAANRGAKFCTLSLAYVMGWRNGETAGRGHYGHPAVLVKKAEIDGGFPEPGKTGNIRQGRRPDPEKRNGKNGGAA